MGVGHFVWAAGHGVGYVVELSGCLVRFLNVFYIWFFECVLSGYDFVICVKVLQFYVGFLF